MNTNKTNTQQINQYESTNQTQISYLKTNKTH